MELTLASRKKITKAQAVRYRMGSRAVKSEILNAVCAVTGHNRDYARRALRLALTPREVKVRAVRPPKYDAEVVAALEKCWAVANYIGTNQASSTSSTACPTLCADPLRIAGLDQFLILRAVDAARRVGRLLHPAPTRSYTVPKSPLTTSGMAPCFETTGRRCAMTRRSP